MKVRICGVPYEIKEVDQNFRNGGVHFGEIRFNEAEILLNKDSKKEVKEESLCHEIVHGILGHIGYGELCSDERFVQAMGNAIYQTFKVKLEK